jgi:anion-transporting  ArsA/GET3 family ATPase
MSALIGIGPLAEQAQDIFDVISNPLLTHYVLVTLPEEMPVTETEELYQKLKSEFSADISLVCNRLIRPPLTHEEQGRLVGKIKDKNMAEFLEFIQYKIGVQEKQWKRLSVLHSEIFGVPLLLEALRGQHYVEKISTYLDNRWTLTDS